MEKLTQEQINKINRNMIVGETEKAIQLRVNYSNNFTGNEKEIKIWVPKSCVELSACGILKIKDWFTKNKEFELKGRLELILDY